MSEVQESVFWDVDEAAVYFGVSTWTVRRMVKAGQLRHERVRGAIRIPKARLGFSPLVKPEEAPAAPAAPAA
jgi:excisionase family DNA binding protein